jgi:exosome complex component RRP46
MTIRNKTEFRKSSVTLGFLDRSDGSCEYSQGDSKVIVCIYGPMEVKTKFEKTDKATVEVVYKPKSGMTTPKDKEIEHMLLSTLEEFIVSKLYPRSSITVVVQVVNDNGSVNCF